MFTRCWKPNLRFVQIVSVLVVVGGFSASCPFRRLKAEVKAGERQLQLATVVEGDSFPQGKLVEVVYGEEEGTTQVAAFKIVDPEVRRVGFVLDPVK